MKSVTKLLIFVVVAVFIGGGCYLQAGGWMMMSPKYSKERLLGLTPAEVVQRLGKPSYDPRVKAGWRSQATDGPLRLGYYQNWATVRVDFENDRVVDVVRSWK